jgi:hypothetical protein
MPIDGEYRSAARFFWGWLVTATVMSVTGNVAHAVLGAHAAPVWPAAGAALVPPTVLLAATHSMALLVRTRTGGLTYWSALAMTLALASFAFVLSFDALRSLAVTLGLAPAIAWLWPCAIDVGIAHATLCLLSVTRAPEAAAWADGGGSRAMLSAGVGEPESDEESAGCVGRDASGGWLDVAESLVRQGVTGKETQLVAAILAEAAAGTAPSTIGRRYKVHHSTVGRILSAAGELAG